jgi:hypothetical protein
MALAVAGIAACPLLPAAPLPQIDFPTVQVAAQLPGASPETMAATAAAAYSDTLPITTVDDFADTVTAQQISQIKGVAQVVIGGEQKPAVRNLKGSSWGFSAELWQKMLARNCALNSTSASISVFAVDDFLHATTAYDLRSRKPVFPQRRIDRRAIGPFQAAYQKVDLAGGLALALPDGLEEDPHRVIALGDGDHVGRFDDGHIFIFFGHARLHRCGHCECGLY